MTYIIWLTQIDANDAQTHNDKTKASPKSERLDPNANSTRNFTDGNELSKGHWKTKCQK